MTYSNTPPTPATITTSRADVPPLTRRDHHNSSPAEPLRTQSVATAAHSSSDSALRRLNRRRIMLVSLRARHIRGIGPAGGSYRGGSWSLARGGGVGGVPLPTSLLAPPAGETCAGRT